MEKVNTVNAVLCYIGLGANLGDRQANIERALALLKDTPGVQVLRVSTLQETLPIGPAQPDYLNGVTAITTTLTPLALLDALQSIENRLGRERSQRWGPRSIDLDLLYYGTDAINHPRLTVPHPQIGQRPFLQKALQEVGFDGR